MVPERARWLVVRHFDLVLEILSWIDAQQYVIAVSHRRDMQTMRVDIGRVEVVRDINVLVMGWGVGREIVDKMDADRIPRLDPQRRPDQVTTVAAQMDGATADAGRRRVGVGHPQRRIEHSIRGREDGGIPKGGAAIFEDVNGLIQTIRIRRGRWGSG